MNFCTKCSSYYQVAGTCNCFAAPQVAPYTQPIYPTTTPVYPTTSPIYPNVTPSYPTTSPWIWGTWGGGEVTLTHREGKYFDASGNEVSWSWTAS